MPSVLERKAYRLGHVSAYPYIRRQYIIKSGGIIGNESIIPWMSISYYECGGRLHGGEAECVQIATRKGAGKPRGNKVLLTWRIAIPQSIVQMEIQMNIIQDAKKLRTRIKSVAKRAGTVQEDIQELLVSCGWHYRQHGDNSLLTQCVNAMPDGVRKERMTGWVAENFQCKWDAENLRFKKAKVSTFLTEAFELDKFDSATNAWWNFEVDTKMNLWALKKKIESLTRDIEKHEGDAKKQALGALDAVIILTDKLHEIGCTKVDKVA